jgi:hypothetical protein
MKKRADFRKYLRDAHASEMLPVLRITAYAGVGCAGGSMLARLRSRGFI